MPWDLDPALTWVGAGALLLILELATGSMFLLWVGLSAFVIAALAFLAPSLGVHWQLAAFAAVGLASTYNGRTYFRGKVGPDVSDRPMLNRRAEQLVGQKVIAVTDFANGRGRVQLADSPWSAQLPSELGNIAVSSGDALEVKGMDGMVLIVAPI